MSRRRGQVGARRAARPAVVAAVATLAFAAAAGVANAHELTAREFTAPVPLPLVFAGAGATVALTALWLGVADRAPSDGSAPASDESSPSRDSSPPSAVTLPSPLVRPVALVARVGFLALFLAALGHGLVGRQVAAENLATLVLWPLLLKGVGLVAVVAGSPWRVLSPWETLYDALVALEGREIAVLGDYPDRLGAWPAVAGFVIGVGVLENLTVATRSPGTTVVVAAGYAALMLAGAAAFGREWFARADALAVLFALLGRVAPLSVRRTDDGDFAVTLRAPWEEVSAPLASASLVAFVVAAVYTVSFDGFTATRAYRGLLAPARDALGVGVASVALYALGLVAFLLSFTLAAALAERLGTGPASGTSPRSGWLDAAVGFGGTVVPIAAAYEVAHNYPFVTANLGGTVAVVRDLALGTEGDPVRLLAGLSVELFWGSQVALVVAGHLVAVVAAHRVATERYGTGSAARRGHAPFVVVMVGYTVLSLWIVSRPLAG
ncbi:hypothetical protein ACFQMA_14830 [Halosimplex aquaticum]|uniref:Uncharacterized protein n=1 Tax=Halosimplex aquaticum TaxID=3026162 RepID=A0ABD5Y479_9EURY|nr:hypothetical protein [Halosimplex aquaticum]